MEVFILHRDRQQDRFPLGSELIYRYLESVSASVCVNTPLWGPVVNTEAILVAADKTGEMLPLMSQPTKLVQLKSRSDTIVCSAIHPEGTWVAYCDQKSFRMFSLQVVSNCRHCSSLKLFS